MRTILRVIKMSKDIYRVQIGGKRYDVPVSGPDYDYEVDLPDGAVPDADRDLIITLATEAARRAA